MAKASLIQKELAATVAAVVDAAPAPKAKPAAKKAPAKKPAAKPAPKAAPKAKTTAKTKAAKKAAFSIMPQYRPKAGRNLAAHTEAALRYFGLYAKGATVQRKELATVIGETAIGYHLRASKCLHSPEQGVIALTAQGAAAFKDRVAGLDESIIAAFLSLFQTGKADDALKPVCGSNVSKFILTAA